MKKLPKKFLGTKSGKKEVKPQPQKSPKISRSITEILNTNWGVVLVSFVCGILLMAIGMTSIQMVDKLDELKRLQQAREDLIKQEQYWQQVVTKYPDYRDGHFTLALLAYQLGEKSVARKELAAVLAIDPDFTQAQGLSSRLGK